MTKVNANFGNSAVSSSIEEEVRNEAQILQKLLTSNQVAQPELLSADCSGDTPANVKFQSLPRTQIGCMSEHKSNPNTEFQSAGLTSGCI